MDIWLTPSPKAVREAKPRWQRWLRTALWVLFWVLVGGAILTYVVLVSSPSLDPMRTGVANRTLYHIPSEVLAWWFLIGAYLGFFAFIVWGVRFLIRNRRERRRKQCDAQV